MTIKRFPVQGGRYYGQRTIGGPLLPVENPDRAPDAWICRRVADFPQGRVPDAGAVGVCAICRAPIVFNPRRELTAPKICMQCAHITPEPIKR